MRRHYRNFHIALITALLLAAVAFEAVADHRADIGDAPTGLHLPSRGGR